MITRSYIDAQVIRTHVDADGASSRRRLSWRWSNQTPSISRNSCLLPIDWIASVRIVRR